MDEHGKAIVENRPLDLPILYRWTPTEVERAGKLEGVACEYVVTSIPEAECGLMLWARWGKEWHCNPWSARPVLRNLLERIKDLEEQLAGWESTQ